MIVLSSPILFVNVNLSPCNNEYDSEGHHKFDKEGKGIRQTSCYKSLDFLKKDLKIHVGNTNKAVVVMMHYPLWSKKRIVLQEREDFYEIIKGYNVIGVISGHTHKTGFRVWNPEKDRVIPIIDAGSPFFWNQATDTVDEANFSLIRVTDNNLEAISYSFTSTCENTDNDELIDSLSSNGNWYFRFNFKSNEIITNQEYIVF